MATERGPRVAVTGVGTVSALGLGGTAMLTGALTRGEPALRPIQALASGDSPGPLGGPLGGQVGDLGAHLTPEEVRRLARASQLVVVACRLAVADAEVEPGALPGLGLVLGSQYGD